MGNAVKSDRRYVRVYDDDLKRDYPSIYADDAALSTWLRLLVIADKMWPSLPELPRSIKPRPLRMLVESGLVCVLPDHCYRIRGHDAERQRRQDAARNAAAGRWQSSGNADGNADALPRRELERERDESTPPPAKLGSRKNGTNPRAQGTNPRTKGTSPRQQKRAGMPDSIGAILARAAAASKA